MAYQKIKVQLCNEGNFYDAYIGIGQFRHCPYFTKENADAIAKDPHFEGFNLIYNPSNDEYVASYLDGHDELEVEHFESTIITDEDETFKVYPIGLMNWDWNE